MKFLRYRIKTVTDEDGLARFVPQKRFFFFFWKDYEITGPAGEKIKMLCYYPSQARSYFGKF